MSERTEFGFARTNCDCRECQLNCQHMPGFLIPADLERMIPKETDPYVWAEKNLLASPGAVVMNTRTGVKSRIPTLVPAVKKDGSCIHLKDSLCTIHEIAPFGCAFFDCRSDGMELSHDGLFTVWTAWTRDTLYARLWKYLQAQGKMQKAPEILRERMRGVEA